MPHRRQALPAFVVLPLLALAALACGERRAGELTVEHDSTPLTPGVEVVADSARGTDARPANTFADSAQVLDARFQQERDAINRDAAAMSGDRRSAEYARRWDALRRRTIAAESLRAERDRLRRRAERERPSPDAAR